MSHPEIEFFFRDPSSLPEKSGHFSRLYLLRRDIRVCYGVDPNTTTPNQPTQAIWAGAIGILIGTDLLATHYAGQDGAGVGRRFVEFAEKHFQLSHEHATALYQLRNAMLHSFGLYSEDRRGKPYKFTFRPKDSVIATLNDDFYAINLQMLFFVFEDGIHSYYGDLCNLELPNALDLHDKFLRMYIKYGQIFF